MKITGNIDFMGEKISCENGISEENVEEAFKFYLERAGYEVERINLDNGITSSCEGYGLVEHTVTKAYFSGVIVMM